MKKRILSILLALAFLCSLLPASALRASAATSGTCGDDLTWNFDSATGTLTIEGSGKMYDYMYGNDAAPWADKRGSIQKITIGNGVTSIGCYAFSNCSSIPGERWRTSISAGMRTPGTPSSTRAADMTRRRRPCAAPESITIPLPRRATGLP